MSISHKEPIPDFGNETLTARKILEPTIQGQWSGLYPGMGDPDAIIQIKSRINFDTEYFQCHTLEILPGGVMVFVPPASVSTSGRQTLKLSNFIIHPGGELHIGSESQPIASNVTILFADRYLEKDIDPKQYGNGLICGGKIRVYGKRKSYIRRESPVSFTAFGDAPEVGDVIVSPNYASFNEGYILSQYPYVNNIATIKDISVIGANIVHINSAPYNISMVADYRIKNRTVPFYVGILSRNVRFVSEGTNRAHIMFLDMADVEIYGAEFLNLGRTTTDKLDSTTFDTNGNVIHLGSNQIGRYGLHFHHVYGPPNKGGRQFVISHCSIWNDQPNNFKWGIALHDSHFGTIENNVVYNYAGAGIVTEDATETANHIIGNLCIGSVGIVPDTFLSDFGDPDGNHGSGIWCKGTNNVVDGNICINNRRYGIVYENKEATNFGNIPLFPGADLGDPAQVSTIRLDKLPILSCVNNITIGGLLGISIYGTKASSEINNLSSWLAGRAGMFLYYTQGLKIKIKNSLLVGSTNNFNNQGIGHDIYSGIMADNCTILGFRYGFRLIGWQSHHIEKCVMDNFRSNILITYHDPSGAQSNIYIISPVMISTSPKLIEMLMSKISDIFQPVNVFLQDYTCSTKPNMRVMFKEQSPDWLIPTWATAAKQTGITNQTLWNTYNQAVAGYIPSSAYTIGEIDGLVE